MSIEDAKWPEDLGERVDPLESFIRYRAQSILTGSLIGGTCPFLSLEQANDVIRWHKPSAEAA